MFVKFADPRDVPRKCDENVGGARQKETPAKSCGQTIEVYGLSPSTRSTEVIVYFEGLCRGRVDNVHRDDKMNVTYVTFERNAGGYLTISNKKLLLNAVTFIKKRISNTLEYKIFRVSWNISMQCIC